MSERPHRGPTSVAIDREVMDWLVDHRTGWLTWLADRLMDLGNVAAYICTALCLLLFFRWGRRTPAVAAVLAGVTALLASDGFKLLFSRDRPPSSQATVWASGPAFPSSASTTTIAVIIVFVTLLAWPSPTWRRRGVAIGLVLNVLIGWAVM